MKIRYFFFALLLFAVVPVFGQSELTNATKDTLQARAKDAVEEFINHLSNIAKKDVLSDRQRQEEIKAALAHFIGNGEKYSVMNEHGERENREPVRMQLSSVRNDNIFRRWLAMKKFLWNLYNNVHKYGKVVLESVDIVSIDNITKVSEGHYEAIAYFEQKHFDFRDGHRVYRDITCKRMKVYIEALQIPEGVTWFVKLGDVYASSTHPLGDGLHVER